MGKISKLLILNLGLYLFIAFSENAIGQSTYKERNNSNPNNLSKLALIQTDPTLPNTFNYFDSIRDHTNKFDFLVNAAYRPFQLGEIFEDMGLGDPTFLKDTYFRGATFYSHIVFDNAKFHSIADFTFTEFNDWVGFYSCVFHGKTDFVKTNFHGNTLFDHTKFKSVADFSESKYESTSDFTSSTFESIANFSNCVFDSLAKFEDVQFKSLANFQNTKFNYIASFQNAKFNSTVNFQDAKLNFKILFNNIVLPDTLNFSNIPEINTSIDFTSALLDSTKKSNNKNYRCRIALVGSDISNIKINYNLFQLYFPAGTPNELIISTYEKLLQRFKDDGFLDSYRMLDIEYLNFKNKHNRGQLINWFQKNWDNYGYNKEYIFKWTLAFLLLFSITNFFAYNWLLRIYKIVTLPTYQRKYNISRLWYAFALTSIVFFSLSLKIDKIDLKNKGGTFYLMIIYTVGLICLAYMANFIIQR